MKWSGRTGLSLSIGAILAYWIYKFLTAEANAEIPDSFSAFVLQVSLVKLAHLTAIALLLVVEKASWREVWTGENWKKRVVSGTLVGLAMFILFNVVLSSVMASIFQPESGGINPAQVLFKDPSNIFIWLLIGVFGGGVVEELSRVFVLTRFEKAFHAAGLYFALLTSSVVFGLGHRYQGGALAVATGLSGLTLGLIYIKRRSTIEVITIHALTDALAIAAAFVLAANH